MRLPNFLIIGAMKAGTTTLYRDLLTNPRVYFPLDKEPGDLASDEVLTEAGRSRYAATCGSARSDQICGEASTTYTKLPDIPGVPERARQVLGNDLRVIYLVREPVSRIISHHYHEYAFGNMVADINRAVREYDQLINYSRYAMQLEPWLKQLGPDHVRIVNFARYIEDRRGTIRDLSEYLGIAPKPELVKPEEVFNPSDGRPAAAGLMWRMTKSPLYRKTVRRILPMGIKGRLRSALLPKAPPRPDPPTMQTVNHIIDRLRSDAGRLQQLMGSSEPLWDFDAVRRRFLDTHGHSRAEDG